MPVTVHVDPIGEDINLIISDLLTPEAQGRQIGVMARQILSDAEQANLEAVGHVPSHATFVDGRIDAAEETVRPNGGSIVYEFDLIDDALAWIGEQLVIHSPVKTGRYQRSHVILADGVEVPVGARLPFAAEYVFVNTQPYARKIEHGESKQAPDGVYQAVATLAQRRFGNLARVSFTYRGVVDLGRQPAVIVTPR